jgi:hypothetical protein
MDVKDQLLYYEAKLLLSWPLDKRREYLAHKNVAKRADELKAEMRRQWEDGKAKSQQG